MHGSGNQIYVAAVKAELCELVERELIWQNRDLQRYCLTGKKTPPKVRVRIRHEGKHPAFEK